MIDLNHWNLTVADANASTYWPPHVESDYLTLHDNGDVELWAPTLGGTTANSDRTRTEFRNIQAGTGLLRNWQIGEAVQLLRVALTLSEVTPNGKVVIGQIHVKDSTRPALKILWDNGTLRAKVRQQYNQSDDPGLVLLEDVPLGEAFSVATKVHLAGQLSLYANHNGREGRAALPLLASYAGKLLYWKAGLYNQEDATEDTPTTVGSRARFTKLAADTE